MTQVSGTALKGEIRRQHRRPVGDLFGPMERSKTQIQTTTNPASWLKEIQPTLGSPEVNPTFVYLFSGVSVKAALRQRELAHAPSADGAMICLTPPQDELASPLWPFGFVGQSGMAGFDARLADSGRAAAKRDGGRIMCSVR